MSIQHFIVKIHPYLNCDHYISILISKSLTQIIELDCLVLQVYIFASIKWNSNKLLNRQSRDKHNM